MNSYDEQVAAINRAHGETDLRLHPGGLPRDTHRETDELRAELRRIAEEAWAKAQEWNRKVREARDGND